METSALWLQDKRSFGIENSLQQCVRPVRRKNENLTCQKYQKNCFGKTPAERAILLLFQKLLYILKAIDKTNSESYDTYIFLDLGMKQINFSKGGVKPAPPIYKKCGAKPAPPLTINKRII